MSESQPLSRPKRADVPGRVLRHRLRDILTVVVIVMAMNSGPVALADDHDGLVTWYPCDETAGSLLHDRSGCGNNGELRGGVTWARGAFGSAVRFDGKDGYVDCGTGRVLNGSRAGSLFVWFRPEQVCQGGLVAWTQGKGKPNQRLVVSLNTYSEPRIDGDPVTRELGLYLSNGQAFDRPFWSTYHRPYFPPADQWLCYAVTFDGRTVNLHRNGVLMETRFQTLVPDLQDVPLWLGRCAGTGGPADYFRGVLDEVRIYNRPLSAQEIYRLYMRTAEGRDQNTESFGSIGIRVTTSAESGTLFADLDYRGLPPTAKGRRIRAELLDGHGKTAAASTVRLLPAWGEACATFGVSALAPGRYVVRAVADVGKPATAEVTWPGRARGWEHVRVLNNFCWELLNETARAAKKGRHGFTNPRRGWVYVVTESEGDLTVRLPGAAPEVLHAPGKGKKQEAMRWVEAGEHTVVCEGPGVLKRLIIRAVPVLLFIHYPHVGPGTGNDSDFLVRHVLSPYNTLHTHAYGPDYNPGEFRQRWAKELGRHVLEGIYPATLLQGQLKDGTAAQQIRDFVNTAPGMNRPEFRGVMLDEFSAGDDTQMWVKSYYDQWTEVCARILEDPDRSSRFVIPFHGYNMFDFRKSSAFLRMFVEHGSYLANEWYLDESDHEGEAWVHLREVLADLADDWESAVPGSTAQTIAVLSYLQRECWNPAVDYKVFLDMQFEHLATRPEFFGLGGLAAYSSYGCNSEEYVRWVSQLCRHYGLEGGTNRLSRAAYELGHLRNPDFVEGAKGWTLSPAEPDSMAVKSHKGYGCLQDRYPYRPWTDTPFLWTRRSPKKPNVFTQELRHLQNGKLYLVRLWIGDYGQLRAGVSTNEDRAVTVRVEEGEPWDEWYRTKLFAGNVYTYTSALMAPFVGDNPYYFKIHQTVFRATGPSARLVISDWASDREPQGPAGQELMFNYIDVHPYLPY